MKKLMLCSLIFLSFMSIAHAKFNGVGITVPATTTSAPRVGRRVSSEAPSPGKEAAAEYFQKSNAPAVNSADHYLALHFGRLMSSQSWEWGSKGRKDNEGENNIGMTYRLGEWINSMDFVIRVDFNEYTVNGERLQKMSFLPMITFPDAASLFPLYFGIGGGLGIFFKQLDQESPLSFDYQLILGARFFNIYQNTGFFIESGLKNHIQITSDGQFNSTFLSGGLVFTF